MKNYIVLSLVLAALLLSISFRSDYSTAHSKSISWPGWVYNYENNIPDSNKILLGRALFYDPVLSRDSSISCASCHLQYSAFTHVDHALSHGIEDRIGNRNSPTLQNIAWMHTMMWDGAINHINVQPLAPIANHLEMDNNLVAVLRKINSQARYRTLSNVAFHSDTISSAIFLKAITQFMLTLVSKDSKYDSVVFHLGEVTFTVQEENGYHLFQKRCNSCHKEPLFTTNDYDNNGLVPDINLNDSGRMKVTGNINDLYKFKIPTLRNIEFSYPYMHDGRYNNLTDVLKHYTKPKEQLINTATTLINGLPITDNEQRDIIAFLMTLTDRKFLFNRNFGYPKEFFSKAE